MGGRAVVIEYDDGRRFVVTDARRAREVHPEAVVVGYEDGTPVDLPEPREERPAPPAEGRKR